jgi:hypothetical protein
MHCTQEAQQVQSGKDSAEQKLVRNGFVSHTRQS